MNRHTTIRVYPYRPKALSYHDWGIGRKPSTGRIESANYNMGKPFLPLPSTPTLHDPDYEKLRADKIKTLDPAPSYSDYIRGKCHGSV